MHRGEMKRSMPWSWGVSRAENPPASYLLFLSSIYLGGGGVISLAVKAHVSTYMENEVAVLGVITSMGFAIKRYGLACFLHFKRFFDLGSFNWLMTNH